VFAYDFSNNVIPGASTRAQSVYWRDVGTIESYAAAHWDLLGEHPRFALDSSEWPIYSGNAPRTVRPIDAGAVSNSIIGPGVRLDGAAVRHSVVQRGARIAAGADLDCCIVMEGATVTAETVARNAIVGADALQDERVGRAQSPAACQGPESGLSHRLLHVAPPECAVVA